MASSTSTAGGLGFRSRLAALARNPVFQAGGYALAGLPIALGAAEQLNQDPGNTLANVAGAGGYAAGGIGGGALAGAISGARFGPKGALIGFGLGSLAGAPVLSGLTRGAASLVQGSPEDRAFRKEVQRAEQMARSQIAIENERILAQMPAMQAVNTLQRQQQQAEMDMLVNAQMRSLYQQGMLGPSQALPGAYSDPNFSGALASIAAAGLG